MKTLTIIMGDIRGGTPTWNSFKKHLIDPLQSDLAIIYEDTPKIEQNILLNIAKFIWPVSYKNNWDEYFLKEYSENIVKNFLIGSKTSFAGGIKNNPGSGARLFGFRDILYKNYLNIIQNYEQIILTRSDFFYIDNHPKLPNDSIWIPEGEDYGGIQDGLNIFPSKHSEKILSICESLEKNKFNLIGMRTISPETVLKEHYVNTSLIKIVKRYPRIQFSVATKKDTTNWSKAHYNTFFMSSLRIKYPSQFINIYKNNKKFSKKLINKINYKFIVFQLKVYKKISKILNYINYHIKKRIHFMEHD